MTLSKAQIRETRERCGISQQMLASRAGVKVLSVKRWEKPGEAEAPADVRAWLEHMLDLHIQAVESALDAVDEMTETQGHAPNHVDLLYYRSQAHYDRFGRDKGDYAIVNARSREIAAILEAQGIEARFRYPEDDEAGFQRLANTR
ncbi:helix-turn-helix domain-containing protein [Bifidobacterium pseudocatenulatum]|uniref:helix-turn-helix domain-containing protein n=1 Tax=Bifidobacterium pseudocatenulatum TaxID=28026 RepID=UPI0018A9CF4E|nr:helix-turn-helix domain-containing protein [Bifidobacterium pseudocatenulatum]